MSRSTTPFDTFLCPHCSQPLFNAVRRTTTPSCAHREEAVVDLRSEQRLTSEEPRGGGEEAEVDEEEEGEETAWVLHPPQNPEVVVAAAAERQRPRPHVVEAAAQQQQQHHRRDHHDSGDGDDDDDTRDKIWRRQASTASAESGNFYDSVYGTYNTPPYHPRPMEAENPAKAAVGGDQAVEPTSSREGTVVQQDDVEQQSQQPAVTKPKHPREGWPAWKWPGMQFAVCLGCILIGYDVSNVANIQAPVYKAFGHVELLPWVAVAYSALNVAVIPLVRRLLVIGNLRWQMALYQLFFLVGAAVAGSSQNMNSLIVGRVITGIGGSGVYQLALVLNVLLTTPAELPRMQGLMGIFWALGLVMGPLIGGAFAQNSHTTWRWALYINMPTLAVMMLANAATIPDIHLAPNLPTLTALASVDWLGFALHAASFVLICSALIFSGSTWSWSSSSAITAWVFVGVLYVAYVLQQRYCLLTTRDRRVFPADLFKRRNVALIAMCVSLAGCAYGVTLYYTPLFFAFTRGFSPVGAAVRLLPYICTFVFFTIFTAILVPIVAVAPPFYIVGGALVMVGAGLQTTLKPSTSEANVMGRDAVIGAGVGCLWQTGVGFVAHMVPPDRKLDVSGLYIVMQLGGTSLMLAVAGAIFQNVGFHFLKETIGAAGGAGQGFSDEDLRQALAGVDSKVWSSADEETVELAVAAVTSVIARINYLILAAGALAFLGGCCMKWERLDFGRKKPAAKDAVEAAEAEKAGSA